MKLNTIISPDTILTKLKAHSKKKILQILSENAAKILDCSEREILDTLSQRERLGPTSIGNGIAIPHGKLESIEHMFGMFAQLETPIDFDASDKKPVDLIFLLLAPEYETTNHLKVLAQISRMFRNETLAEELRKNTEADALHSLLTQDYLLAAYG